MIIKRKTHCVGDIDFHDRNVDDDDNAASGNVDMEVKKITGICRGSSRNETIYTPSCKYSQSDSFPSNPGSKSPVFSSM